MPEIGAVFMCPRPLQKSVAGGASARGLHPIEGYRAALFTIAAAVASRVSAMSVDRAKVVGVIKEYTDALGAKRGGAAPVEQRDDAAVVREALTQACARAGITPEDYAEAVRADSTLVDLETQSLNQATVGTTDPGPYDAISRESSSGQAGDLTKAREA